MHQEEEIIWEGKIVLKRIHKNDEMILRLDDKDFDVGEFMKTVEEHGNLGEALIVSLNGVLDLLKFELLMRYAAGE